jgi:hypothetical protein
MKVRDHDHVTGEFRGAAHSYCNLKMRQQAKIPVFFHNFRGYDSHLIVQAFDQFKERNISVIGSGMEKYMLVSWGDHLVFKDSLQFLTCSLESLAANLLKSGREKFQILFKEIDHPNVDLLLRKGLYPYEYMDRIEKLNETQLPPKAAFYSKLREEEISDEDYAHAQDVWQAFGCTRMQEYHDIYLKSMLN